MSEFKLVVVNDHTGEKLVFTGDEANLARSTEDTWKDKIYINIINITPKNECANCGDKSQNLSGACQQCFQMYLLGHIIKTKDTLDKDRWTCGCETRPEEVYLCSEHKNDNSGPLGDP